MTTMTAEDRRRAQYIVGDIIFKHERSYDRESMEFTVREVLKAHAQQAREEALREAIKATEINVHEHASYQNGQRNGLKIAREAIKALMDTPAEVADE